MILLPYENYTLNTRLSHAEIKKRLENVLEPKKGFRLKFFGSDSFKPYEGEIEGDRFKINRIIRYRNSFLPYITGVIVKNSFETEIHIKMQLHPAVFVFMCIWLFITGMMSTVMLSHYASATNEPGTFTPLLMFGFGYVITIAGFKFESYNSKLFLADLFNADTIKS